MGQAKVTILTGSCGTVGLSGWTVGGGFGLIRLQVGLAIDAVAEIQVVFALGGESPAQQRNAPTRFGRLEVLLVHGDVSP